MFSLSLSLSLSLSFCFVFSCEWGGGVVVVVVAGAAALPLFISFLCCCCCCCRLVEWGIFLFGFVVVFINNFWLDYVWKGRWIRLWGLRFWVRSLFLPRWFIIVVVDWRVFGSRSDLPSLPSPSCLHHWPLSINCRELRLIKETGLISAGFRVDWLAAGGRFNATVAISGTGDGVER